MRGPMRRLLGWLSARAGDGDAEPEATTLVISGSRVPTGLLTVAGPTLPLMLRSPLPPESSPTLPTRTDAAVAGDLADCLPSPPPAATDQFDLCLCGDDRRHHANRDGRCLLCWHDPYPRCQKFTLAVGE